MTNLKTTRGALFASIASLVICFSMLLGTTFAWFTDSVSSSGNIIQTGTLDVQLLMFNGSEYVDISDSKKPIFGENSLIAEYEYVDLLWEPGKTQIVYLGVKNAGDLALKYNIVVDTTDAGLLGALDYAIIDGAKKGVNAPNVTSWNDILATEGVQAGVIADGRTVAASNGALESDSYDYFALAVHMNDSVGNEYQGKSVEIDINIVATQLSDEEDSTGPDYDNDAEFPEVKLPAKNVSAASTAELKEILAEAANSEQELIIDATGVSINIAADDYMFEIPGGVTLKGATVTPTYRGISYIMFEPGAGEQVVFEDCTFGDTSRILTIGGYEGCPSSVVYNNCTFKGQVITNFVENANGVAEFNNCKFTKSASSTYNYIEAMGGTHVFNSCTFDYTGVSQTSMGVITSGQINVYSEDEYSTLVILNGCTRTNCGTRIYGPNSKLEIK